MLKSMLGARTIAVVLCGVALSGCAALIVPQVDPRLPPQSSTPVTRAEARSDFTKARTYVNDLRIDIIRKRDQHASTQWGYLGAVLAMVTAIAGLGATGTTGAPIIALGLGAAATTTAGTTLPIQERIGVYNVALEALECIEAAAGAFDFPAIREAMLKGHVNGDPEQPSLDTIKSRITTYEAQLEAIQDRNEVERKLLEEVTAKLGKIADTQSRAQAIFAFRGAAAGVLTDNASLLATRMNQALSERDPNLRSTLYSLVPNSSDMIHKAALAAFTSPTGPRAAAAALRPAPPAPRSHFSPVEIAAVRDELRRADAALAAAATVIKKLDTDPDVPVKACVDRARDALGKRPMTVFVSDQSAIAPDGDATLLVDGGTRPYFVDLIGSAASNLSKSEKEQPTGAYNVTIKALPTAKSDSYTVNVRDSSTPPQTVSQVITVTAAPPELSAKLISTQKPPIKAGEKVIYRITGGQGKYTATAAAGEPVMVATPVPDQVEITAKTVTTNTDAVVKVTDEANHTLDIKVGVKP